MIAQDVEDMHGRRSLGGRLRRAAAGALVLGALAVVVPAPAGAATGSTSRAPSAETSPEDELLATYAPVLAVRSQSTACGGGEPYLPMTVDALFDVDGLVLRGPSGEVRENPTLDDLTALAPGDDWYIDIPGNALRPKCTYETLYDALATPPTIYGRVATDPDHPGQIVAQYWFFYLYNDWNDRHEGDWEMAQLRFEASDAAEALRVGPVEVAYAQHEGAQVSEWEDGALTLVDGTHPVVFPGQGSHASYYASQRWFGKSAQSGFGCDDTRTPLDQVRPTVQRMTGDEPWLDFLGHWGEQQPSFNNGPTGPSTKTQWDAPVSWVIDEGRVGAVSLPAQGSTATDFFCGATRAGSLLMLRFFDSPWRVLLALIVAVAAVVMAARATRWRPMSISPVSQRRAAGQTIGAAVRLVRSRKRLFFSIGSVLFIAGSLAALAQALLVDTTEVGDAFDVSGDGSATGSVIAAVIGLMILVPAVSWVQCAVTWVVGRFAVGEDTTWADAMSAAWRRPRAFGADLVTRVVVTVLLTSGVLAPVGVWLAARWAVVVAAGQESPHPWRRSAFLTRGSRLRSFSVSAVATTLSLVLPGLIGTLVLLLTDASFLLVNVVAGAVSVFVVPIAGTMVALLHIDLVLRSTVDVSELVGADTA